MNNYDLEQSRLVAEDRMRELRRQAHSNRQLAGLETGATESGPSRGMSFRDWLRTVMPRIAGSLSGRRQSMSG